MTLYMDKVPISISISINLYYKIYVKAAVHQCITTAAAGKPNEISTRPRYDFVHTAPSTVINSQIEIAAYLYGIMCDERYLLHPLTLPHIAFVVCRKGHTTN